MIPDTNVINLHPTGMVQVPVGRYVEHILGPRPMGYIDNVDRAIIMSCEGWDILHVIEDDAATIGMDGRVLGAPTVGLYRLWLRKDWLLCDNRRQLAARNIAEAHAEKQRRREVVITHFGILGIPRATAEMAINTMDDTTFGKVYDIANVAVGTAGAAPKSA